MDGEGTKRGADHPDQTTAEVGEDGGFLVKAADILDRAHEVARATEERVNRALGERSVGGE